MSDFIYRFEGVKITNGWKHPLNHQLVIKNVKWLDSQSPEKLEALQITKHDKPVPPEYDRYYQRPVEQPSGEYVIEDLPLADVKAKKKAELTAIKERKEQEGFMFRDKLIQTDLPSYRRIETAGTAALAAKLNNVPFYKEWTAADNTIIPLDADGMIAMHAALVEMGQTYHTQCEQLKAQVMSPTRNTGAKVKAVEWPE
jgi:hypothetical protein